MIGNPVLYKELLLRARMRQPTPTRLGIGIAIVILLGWIYYEAVTTLLSDPNPSSARSMWSVVMWVQFLLVGLIAPALTANAIAQEKEQQTWEMLLFTRLRADEIIFGKLFARMAVIVFLMLLALPISLFCVLHANINGSSSDAFITPGLFASTYVTTLLTGLFFATFGLFMSWMLNRTLYALITSYTFVIGGLTIFTALVTLILSYVVSDNDFFYRCPLIWLNPIQLFLEASSHTALGYPQTGLYLIFGLTGYAVLTALMLWRMIAGFRRN